MINREDLEDAKSSYSPAQKRRMKWIVLVVLVLIII